MEKLIVYSGVEAGLAAILNQAATMEREQDLAKIRIAKLKATIKERALEWLIENVTDEPAIRVHIARAVLAHETFEPCALEPGWDVVQ